MIFTVQNALYINYISNCNCLYITLFESFKYFDTPFREKKNKQKVEMIYLLSQRQEMVEESMPSVLNPRIFKLYYVAWKISSKDEGNEYLSERNFNFDHRK